MKPEEVTRSQGSADDEVTPTPGKSVQVKKRGTKRPGRPIKKKPGRTKRIQNGSADTSISNEAEYVVEKVVKHRISPDGEIEYFVKWENWSDDSNTWEPIDHLKENCLDYVVDYFERSVGERVEWVSQVGAFKKAYFNFSDQEIEKTALQYIAPDEDVFPDIDLEDLERRTNLIARLPRVARERSLIEELKNDVLIYKAYQRRQSQLENLADWASEINLISSDMAPIKVENQVDLDIRPLDFKYINSYIYPESGVEKDPVIGCDCGPKCVRGQKCKCAESAGGKIFYQNGLNCLPKGTPIYECNSTCKCGLDCENRLIQRGRTIPLCIFRTNNGCGWGVKTLKKINKGEFVTEYVGEVIPRATTEERSKVYSKNKATYLFDLDFEDLENFSYTVDASEYGNVSHFINHSCNPNLVVYVVWVECQLNTVPRLGLFACRNIQPNEEIAFDYLCSKSTKKDNKRSKSSNNNDMTKCKCNYSKCRIYLH